MWSNDGVSRESSVVNMYIALTNDDLLLMIC